MSDQAADELREEWRLVLKMGYAPRWTLAQKQARLAEIEHLLVDAGHALPDQLVWATTLGAVAASVPLHLRNGRPFYVDLAEIPEPWRERFKEDLRGSQCPIVPGVAEAAYAWDWVAWAGL